MATKFAWLIELASSPTCGPLYLRRHFDETCSWTSNHDLAHKFPSQDEAGHFAKLRMSADSVRIAEHGWG